MLGKGNWGTSWNFEVVVFKLQLGKNTSSLTFPPLKPTGLDQVLKYSEVSSTSSASIQEPRFFFVFPLVLQFSVTVAEILVSSVIYFFSSRFCLILYNRGEPRTAATLKWWKRGSFGTQDEAITYWVLHVVMKSRPNTSKWFNIILLSVSVNQISYELHSEVIKKLRSSYLEVYIGILGPEKSILKVLES